MPCPYETMALLIIDYGMGNLGSVRRAFEECGASVVVSDKADDIKSASHVVLPGVGAFADGIANLKDNGWVTAIHEAVVTDKIPFLGICLGMQLIADKSFEGGEHAGLGLIPGEVKRFVPVANERVPHVGWNEIHPAAGVKIFEGVAAGTDVYFVHSFHFVPKNPSHVAATTPYCGKFVSAVASDNIFGVQFHPEKSAKTGFQIIRNFLAL